MLSQLPSSASLIFVTSVSMRLARGSLEGVCAAASLVPAISSKNIRQTSKPLTIRWLQQGNELPSVPSSTKRDNGMPHLAKAAKIRDGLLYRPLAGLKKTL